MYINLANVDLDRLGGGWSFARTLVEALKDDPQITVTDYDQSEIVLICGASMVNRAEVEQAKQDGKKIVLRVDNALLPSRNRNGGMTHMRDYAGLADLVIYQSQWARHYLSGFLGKDGPVILNAVDEKVFNAKKRQYHGLDDEQVIYLYVRSGRTENKMWDAARYYFSRMYEANPKSQLWIVGKFSPENVDYKFDFFNNENYKFFGEQPPDFLAGLYRQADILIAPYFNDACSNTIIEGLMSGCILLDNPFLKTGGTPEIIKAFNDLGHDYFSLKRLRDDYFKVLEALYEPVS